MKSIRVDSLLPNLTFDQPAYLDERYIILTPDITIDETLVELLKKFNFEKIYTDGKPSQVLAADHPEEHKPLEYTLEDNVKEKNIEEVVNKFYFDFINFTKEIFTLILQKNEIKLTEVTEKIKQATEHLKTNKDLVIRFSEFKVHSENYIYNHSVNSCLLALAIGLTLKFPPHRLIELGIAAIFHDLGMLKLPPDFYLSERKLEANEKKTVMAHTVIGYKILKSLDVPESIALTCLEHHERVDGSGYPRALKAEQISLYGKIISLVCSFDACTGERPYKDSMDGYHGIIDLLKNNKNKYDETILKALILTISLYPVGSYVLLSNKSIGIVTKTNPNNPKCPVVKVLIDKNGNQLAEPLLLPTSTQSDGISIIRVLEENERPTIT